MLPRWRILLSGQSSFGFIPIQLVKLCLFVLFQTFFWNEYEDFQRENGSRSSSLRPIRVSPRAGETLEEEGRRALRRDQGWWLGVPQ